MTHLKMMSFSLHQHDHHLISVGDGPGVSLIFPELTHFLWLDSRPPGNPYITPYSSENINLHALSRSPKLKYGWIEVRIPTFIKPAILPHLVDLRLQVEVEMHHEVARRLFSGMDKLKLLTIERTRFAEATTKVEGIIKALSLSRIDLTGAEAATNAPDGEPPRSYSVPSAPLCPLLERLAIAECMVSPTELARFAFIRRSDRDAPVLTSPRLTAAEDIPAPFSSSSGGSVVPCRITLRGCPGLPNVERVFFKRLRDLLDEKVKAASSQTLLDLQKGKASPGPLRLFFQRYVNGNAHAE